MSAIPRTPTLCQCCGKVLTDGLDTYGDVNFEVCRDCHWSMTDDENAPVITVEDFKEKDCDYCQHPYPVKELRWHEGVILCEKCLELWKRED